MTSQLFTPSVSTVARMPGAPVPSRSVQNGASTLFGLAGLPKATVGSNWMSAEPFVPPATR
jgi:hypothetical protein